jgi:hypothetical protein
MTWSDPLSQSASSLSGRNYSSTPARCYLRLLWFRLTGPKLKSMFSIQSLQRDCMGSTCLDLQPRRNATASISSLAQQRERPAFFIVRVSLLESNRASKDFWSICLYSRTCFEGRVYTSRFQSSSVVTAEHWPWQLKQTEQPYGQVQQRRSQCF